jgi:glucose/mannose-6-phosphate isomerase
MSEGMEKAIVAFAEQFTYEPEIVNADKLGDYSKYVLVGMGGSHLQGDIVKNVHPDLDLVIWKDYGLPPLSDLSERLVILSSYSGNTEEVLDALSIAGESGIPTAVITTGGKLLEVAEEIGIPYVKIPETGIQPRVAIGYTTRALLLLLSLSEDLVLTKGLSSSLDVMSIREEGGALAEHVFGTIPVIYSSRKNETLAYNWKIKANESAKIPAFYNIFPELNHNELAGMDVVDSTRSLYKQLSVIFLMDESDHERVQLRMRVTKELYSDRGILTTEIPVLGLNTYEKIFRNLILADWFSIHMAKKYGTEPEAVPIIEELKRMIA